MYSRKSQIETCFSLVSRGKRGLGGFGEHLVEAVSNLFMYGANKNSPKIAVQIKNF